MSRDLAGVAVLKQARTEKTSRGSRYDLHSTIPRSADWIPSWMSAIPFFSACEYSPAGPTKGRGRRLTRVQHASNAQARLEEAIVRRQEVLRQPCPVLHQK